MKQKTIFNFALAVGLMLVVMSFASANISGVNFTKLNESQNVSGDVLVNWTYQGIPALDLQYGRDCNGPWESIQENINAGTTQKIWDTQNVSDGNYCLRIYEDSNNNETSANFTVDNSAPNASFNDTIFVGEEGNNTTITANVSDNLSGVKNWTLEFSENGPSVNGTSKSISEHHNYTSEGRYNLTLEVFDNAGNSETVKSKVVVTMPNPDWVIRLDKGINYVSVPFVPKNNELDGSNTALDGIKDNLETIWSYRPGLSSGGSSWISTVPTCQAFGSTQDWCGDVDEIRPLRGYVFDMNKTDVFYGEAQTYSSTGNPKKPNSIKLESGNWSLIGINNVSRGGVNTSNLNNSNVVGSTQSINNPVASVKNSLGNKISSIEQEKSYWTYTRPSGIVDAFDYLGF